MSYLRRIDVFFSTSIRLSFPRWFSNRWNIEELWTWISIANWWRIDKDESIGTCTNVRNLFFCVKGCFIEFYTHINVYCYSTIDLNYIFNYQIYVHNYLKHALLKILVNLFLMHESSIVSKPPLHLSKVTVNEKWRSPYLSSSSFKSTRAAMAKIGKSNYLFYIIIYH